VRTFYEQQEGGQLFPDFVRTSFMDGPLPKNVSYIKISGNVCLYFVIFEATVGLGTHLFVKVSRPRDSEVTFSVFESSCHLCAGGDARMNALS